MAPGAESRRQSLSRQTTIDSSASDPADGTAAPEQYPLVDLVHIDSTYPVEIDLVYAGSHNFVCLPIYVADAPCLLHPDAAACLMRAALAARRSRLTLKVFDAYRPPAAQEVLWRLCPNPQYVADPAQGSNHSRGVAVDVTLLDENGKALDMGTGFDEMREQSHHDRDDLPVLAQRNRALLLGVMLQAGFASLPTEWWHYQLNNASNYPLQFEKGVSLHVKAR